MKLTQERKVYAAVLGLGLSALAVDRLFFGGATLAPGSASAAAPGAPAGPLPALQDVAGEQGAAAAPVCALAARLESIRPGVVRSRIPSNILAVSSPLHPAPRWLLRDPEGTAGLFTTKASWLAPSAPAASQAPAAHKESLKDILERHAIKAVVAGSNKGDPSFLWIDGELRPVGYVFDGVKIAGITKGLVTLEYGRERLELDFEKRADDR